VSVSADIDSALTDIKIPYASHAIDYDFCWRLFASRVQESFSHCGTAKVMHGAASHVLPFFSQPESSEIEIFAFV